VICASRLCIIGSVGQPTDTVPLGSLQDHRQRSDGLEQQASYPGRTYPPIHCGCRVSITRAGPENFRNRWDCPKEDVEGRCLQSLMLNAVLGQSLNYKQYRILTRSRNPNLYLKKRMILVRTTIARIENNTAPVLGPKGSLRSSWTSDEKEE
jgi:hypothetical protein